MFSDIRGLQQLYNSPNGGMYAYSKSASKSQLRMPARITTPESSARAGACRPRAHAVPLCAEFASARGAEMLLRSVPPRAHMMIRCRLVIIDAWCHPETLVCVFQIRCSCTSP